MGMVDLHPVQSGRLTYPCSVNELLYQLVQLFLRKIIRSLWTASVDSIHSLQSAVTDLGHNPAASPVYLLRGLAQQAVVNPPVQHHLSLVGALRAVYRHMASNNKTYFSLG